jgi:hypothetical protein
MKKQEKTKCVLCGETGGRFRYSPQGYFHIGRCGFRAADRVAPSPVFPFTTTHLDHPSVVAEQGPLVINNMQELRRYERMAGVASDPFSNDSSYQNERY